MDGTTMETLDYSAADYPTLRTLMLHNRFPGKTIFNFLNLYSVWLFKHNPVFRESVTAMRDISKTLIDSGVISVFLRSKRLRGPTFTRSILNDPELLAHKTHFFLGFNDQELDHICTLFSLLLRQNVFGHVSAYTKTPRAAYGFREDSAEIDTIAALIQQQKINYLWIGTGNPRQEIMARELHGRVAVDYILSLIHI